MNDHIKALEEIIDPDFIWGALDNVHDAETTLADYAAAVSRAQRAALTASQPAQPVAVSVKPLVRVKPLEWSETHGDRGDGRSEHNGGYEAESVFGAYEVSMGFGSDCYYFSVSDPNLNEIGSFEDPEYAKAAAQADYEARIMAALDVQPLTVQDAARRILSDDIAISHMAQALHDGPLGADDHWFSAARPRGAWCVDAVRVVLRAIAEGK